MEMRGGEQQCQHADHGLPHPEIELPQKAKAEQRRQHRHQNVGAVADDDVAHGGIGAVVLRENGKPLDVGSNNIGGEHQQRLPYAVPALQLSVAPVNAELGILIGKDRRLRSPESMCGLVTMRGVGGAELA